MSSNTPAGNTQHPTQEATPSVVAKQPQQKPPISLRQTKVRLKCGTIALRIDLCLESSSHAYAIGVYPGFVGGGRGADNSLAPRLRSPDFSPKMRDVSTGQPVEVWPPVAAVERRVDGVEWDDTHLPEGTTPQRLELALSRVEPLLRQLVNHRQLHMDAGRPGAVADQPLIARIKAILADI